MTSWRVDSHDWPAIPGPLPLGELYKALEGLTEADAAAALDTLRDVRVPGR